MTLPSLVRWCEACKKAPLNQIKKLSTLPRWRFSLLNSSTSWVARECLPALEKLEILPSMDYLLVIIVPWFGILEHLAGVTGPCKAAATGCVLASPCALYSSAQVIRFCRNTMHVSFVEVVYFILQITSMIVLNSSLI